MGLPAYQEQMASLVSGLPFAPVFNLPAANDNDDDPVAEFNRAYKIYIGNITNWRATMIAKVDEFEKVISAAYRENPEFCRPLVEMIDQTVDFTDKQIAKANAAPIISDVVQEKFERIVRLNPSAKGVVRSLRKKVENGASVYMKGLVNIRNQLKRLVWEYDPDARGGPTFDNPLDLEKYLTSVIAE